MSTQMKYTPGSLVTVREREWIVLPGSTDQLIQIRPIDGTEDEVTKVLTELEDVQPASFALPSTDQIGDYRS
ncbi:MAG: hypothetical protein PHQ75_12850, partial [Thermoguttaceae bacterium]|nr:hypothetical protein [Thermoguttaceae bacterium]